jgi:single-strand DNA-binding protein
MASFNKVMLMGNLTRDPQVKHIPSSNTVVAEFGLAVSRRYRTQAGEDREEVAFVDCTAFARQAETIAQFCTKGKALFVEGRLKYDTWEDKNTQAKRSKLTVVVENFQFIGGKGDAGGNGNGDEGQVGEALAPPPRQRSAGRTGLPDTALAGGGRSRRPPASDPLDGYQQHAEDSDIPF